MKTVFIFGLGYTGQVFAKRAAGFDIVGTVRTREAQLRLRENSGIEAFVFDGATFDPPLSWMRSPAQASSSPRRRRAKQATLRSAPSPIASPPRRCSG